MAKRMRHFSSFMYSFENSIGVIEKRFENFVFFFDENLVQTTS